MAIQIIDNFNLSVAKPIDDRFVVGSQSFYTDKNNIPYKYSGLRVWDLNDGIPYVWNGLTWASENSVSVSGSGSASYVPRFIGPPGTSNAIGNSNIYISGPTVGINNTSPGYTLDVTGTINSNILRSPDGSNIFLLNATNIATGTLQLARLSNLNANTTFVPGWGILASGASQPTYINPSTLTVGGSSASVIFSDTTSPDLHYISFFNGYSGTLPTRVSRVSGITPTPSVRQLTYQPSTGTLTSALITTGTFSVGPGSTSSPSISFSSVTSTGIYRYSTQGFGISVLGSAKLTIDSTGIRHISSVFTSSGVSPASFTIGTGTASSTTKITIAALTYDRIIYLYSSNHDNAYYLTSGWFQIEINVAAQKIYSAFFGTDSGVKSVHNNHCYILPSGVASTVTLRKDNLGYAGSVTGPTITVTSLKFGL